MLKSEIQRAIITDVSAEAREGIEVPTDLVDVVGLCDGEKVVVASTTSGARLETYVQATGVNTGQIVLLGSGAHLIRRGERVTIMAFGYSHEPVLPQKVVLNERNEVQR